ncbi:MAG: hypothetical protein HYY06_16070 [Deltaproteobacteria bacterium]|nr:hypothetical protein [Deltaproteobacteria bacterium]
MNVAWVVGAWVVGLAVLLGSGIAEACPQCATRAGGGVSQVVILGALILLPYAVVSVVLRAIKSELAREAAEKEGP